MIRGQPKPTGREDNASSRPFPFPEPLKPQPRADRRTTRNEVAMADHYTKFCFEYRLPSAITREDAVALAQRGKRIREGDESPDEFPEELQAHLENWVFDVEHADLQPNTLIVFSEEGGVEAAAAYVQHLLRRHDPLGRFGFEWCHDADKLTEDAHGGGAAIISADAIDYLYTGSWLQQQLKRNVTVHGLELRLQIDRAKDRDVEVRRLIEKIDELLHREFTGYDAGLVAHPDEVEIEEHGDE